MTEILRTLYAWFCTCGDSGYPQSDREAAAEFGRLHERDCVGTTTTRPVEPL